MLKNTYQALGSDFYKTQDPDQINCPQLLVFNDELAQFLNLEIDNPQNILSGNALLPGSKPSSLAYAGHQFGHFVPQLGDGRAVLLGEAEAKNGELFDVQLKGSGKTYFSRNGDGKCPLSAAIREYVVSEAMYYLNIPTTRALALVKSDALIYREDLTPSAVITRVAKSHIRVGTFEYFAAKGDVKNVKKLADYVIARHYPGCDSYLSLLSQVIKNQAELVSSWMAVGFIHGVMNTDNMLICGQTIDYGPCAFLDEYDQDKCFSFIDKRGRYRFSNQKNIALWNLTRFGEAILPLIDDDLEKGVELAQKELDGFVEIFEERYYAKMAQKIGIVDVQGQDRELIDDFLAILQNKKMDFTNSFRNLSEMKFKDRDWEERWLKRIKSQGLELSEIAKNMDAVNPVLIPRNHIVQSLIDGDVDDLKEFLEAVKNPFVKKKGCEKYYCEVDETKRVRNTFCGT